MYFRLVVIIQILDAEISGDSAEVEVEGENDGREKEKMLFSVIFSANDDTLKEEANLDKISPLAQKNSEKKEEKADQRLVKIKIMKQIAFFINPLVYVLYSVIYFIYYLFFF